MFTLLSGMFRQTPFQATLQFGRQGCDRVDHLASSPVGHDIFLTFIVSILQTSFLLMRTCPAGVVIHSRARDLTWALVLCGFKKFFSRTSIVLSKLFKGRSMNIHGLLSPGCLRRSVDVKDSLEIFVTSRYNGKLTQRGSSAVHTVSRLTALSETRRTKELFLFSVYRGANIRQLYNRILIAK